MSDSEPNHIHQWRLAVLSAVRAGGTQTEINIPIFSLEDMDPSTQAEIKGYYQERGWEYCHNKTCPRSGSHYKVKKCAACGTVPGREALYCSRRCQWLDWPVHKHRCRDFAIDLLQAATTMALLSGTDASIIPNCTRLSAQRAEGLKMILAWLFDTIYRSNPGINLRETCLTIHCRSSRLGKGRIIPVAYQLEEMTETTFGLPPPHVYDLDKGKEMVGTVQISIDTVYLERVYFPLTIWRTFIINNNGLSGQWPWIFATIASMQNYNVKLWMRRLQHLHIVVETFEQIKTPEVLHFQAPKNLRNGERWEIYDFDKWLELFGNVVNF